MIFLSIRNKLYTLIGIKVFFNPKCKFFKFCNFFRIMKSELLYAEKFESPEDFTKALEGYIDYYNNKRIKSRLKGKSPVQYRTLSITG